MHSVNSSPSITTQYFEALTRRKCDKTSIIAKITCFALPLILLVTTLIDLFISCLASKPIVPTVTIQPSNPLPLPFNPVRVQAPATTFSRCERAHLPSDVLVLLDVNGYQYFDKRPKSAELALTSIAVYPKIVNGSQQYVVAITGNTPESSDETFKFYFENKQCLNDEYTKMTMEEKRLSPSIENAIYLDCIKMTLKYRAEPLSDLPVAIAIRELLYKGQISQADIDFTMHKLHQGWEDNQIWNRENP